RVVSPVRQVRGELDLPGDRAAFTQDARMRREASAIGTQKLELDRERFGRAAAPVANDRLDPCAITRRVAHPVGIDVCEAIAVGPARARRIELEPVRAIA